MTQSQAQQRRIRGGLAWATLALWGIGLGAVSASALPMTVRPGQALEIDFSFSAAPTATLPGPSVLPVDTLTFRILTGVVSGFQSVTVELEGSGILGSDTTSLSSPIWAFTDPGSAWPSGLNRTDVVFASIADGSILGTLRLTPSFAPGAVDPRLEVTFTEVLAARSLSGGGVVAGGPLPTVSAARLVPEPGVALLLAVGAIARIARPRRSPRRRRQPQAP